jgi:ribokinase
MTPAPVGDRPLRLGVIGHVEWVIHSDAPFIPVPGEIVHLKNPLEQPAGGGAVTAAALARKGAEVSFFTALGRDAITRPALEALGVRVLAAERPVPQTRALVMRDPAGERTIAVVGENLHPTADDPLPWEELASLDGVYFTGMDPRTLQLARAAPVVVVTARRFESLVRSGVRVDALVGSARDRGEQFDITRLSALPEHVVITDGMRGGTGYEAVPPPGPIVDTYGAGDTFVAGVVYDLAAGRPIGEATALGARWAAETVTWRGAYP